MAKCAAPAPAVSRHGNDRAKVAVRAASIPLKVAALVTADANRAMGNAAPSAARKENIPSPAETATKRPATEIPAAETGRKNGAASANAALPDKTAVPLTDAPPITAAMRGIAARPLRAVAANPDPPRYGSRKASFRRRPGFSSGFFFGKVHTPSDAPSPEGRQSQETAP